ncbi:DUF4252 domain-containing protein [Flavobacterium soli]|uniref:DUF4252 domain-containing protein n=1 Tax=Flavobacterium soli TaxID=344881 RepID=UPI00041662C1|nr:DUF4252 domain-containing protein [Flavobacterium soli]
MRKFIITTVLVLLPSLFFAQSAFDKFNDLDDVTTVIINKKSFDLLEQVKLKMDDKTEKYISQVKNIDNFKMFSTSSTKISEDMKQTFKAYAKKQNLEQLMSIKEDGNDISIYVKSNDESSKVSELLMFIEGGDKKGDQTMILSVTGNFDLAALNQ